MKKNNNTATVNTATVNNNYAYSTFRSGNQTIVVWDNLAQMMMGNSIPAQGYRILKEKEGKGKSKGEN